MKFINKSEQTVHLTDIDLSIPYLEDLSPQDISLTLVKKSRNFRQMVMIGMFSITDHGHSPFEKSLKKQEGKIESKKTEDDNWIKMDNNMNNIEVKIRGHFYEAGGYAKVNRNLAKALHKKGFAVNIAPTAQNIMDLSPSEIAQLAPLRKNVSKNAIVIDSMVPSFGNILGGKYKILYTTVESDTIPQQFIDCLNMYNEIWTVSDYCKEVISRYVDRKVVVIPNSIDNELYNTNVEPYKFTPELNPFVFVSVFGWGYRKGYDALLRAYLEEFTENDPVTLLIISRYQGKTNRSDKIKETINDYINKYAPEKAPHIARFSKVISEEDMPRVYNACDAFVLFSRGEGWGLGYTEASLCGLPVIATNHSGHTMFLKDNNSKLVDIDRKSLLQPGLMHVHYWDNQLFPELKSDKFISDCKNAMRDVYENYSNYKNKNKILSQFISDNYNVNEVSRLAATRLREIWSNIK